MKFFSFLFLFLVVLVNTTYSQNAIVGPAFSTGWGGGSCPTGTNDFNWFSNSFGSSFIGTFSPNNTGNQYFRFGIGWDNTTAQRTITVGSDTYVTPNNPYTLNSNCTTSGALYYNVPSINYKYIFKTFNAGVNPTGKFIFFEVQGDIRSVTSVSQSPIPSSVQLLSTTAVTVTANTDGNVSTGQSLYLRYTTNNWTTSTIAQMSGSGTTYTGSIPAQPAGTEVDYYVFTSGTGLTIGHSDADWYTINANTNSGSNYSYTVFSGAVTVSPPYPADNQPVTITFDATGTSLAGADKVYLHSGVSTKQNTPTSFDYTIGNWGQDDGVGVMTNIVGNNWQIVLNPGLRTFYSVSAEDDIFGLNFLFRDTNGSKKVDNNGLNYHNAADPGSYFSINVPVNPVYFGQVGSALQHSATANIAPTTWTLTEIDTLTGAFLSTLATQNGNVSFAHNIDIIAVPLRKFKLEVNFSGTIKYKTFSLRGYNPIVLAARPEWTKPGINYHGDDPTKATLVLHAPTYTRYKKGTGIVSGTSNTAPKSLVYVVGDFNNWLPLESFKMKRDRDGWDGTTDADNDWDRGDYWWIELSGLNPGQEYVFQYFIDGELYVADPYTHKVSDFDDQYITESVYPDLIDYRSQANDRASVLQTAPSTYNWTAPTFTPPSINELNIYELHFRDFTDEGTYLAAIDKLDYIKGLGVTAIHVMPVSEFEGNSSWGYNPNFYFAPDKAYGTANDLKKFIDECHKRKILVFNDIVLNHAFYSNVMAKMYWNNVLNRPANDNPWFNPEHKMIYDSNGHWGADWNHESEHVQTMVDRILDHWLQEYNFDGFRFDFTKGFGQTEPDPGDSWAGSKDQDRIDLLLRMANGMKSRNPGSVVIFEHLADNDEENDLADQGILMWSGVGHHNSIKNFTLGWNGDDTDIYNSGVFTAKGFTYANLMSYAESHDEQRQAFNIKSWFNWAAFAGPKSTSSDSLNAIVDRVKIGLAFNLLLPGPRMLWQFQELGYDISIDFNGRTGEKPVRWNYYDNTKRRELFNLASKLLKVRNQYNLYSTTPDYGNINLGAGNVTVPRVMRLSSNTGKHVIVVANLDPAAGHDVIPNFDITGTWYKYNGNPAFDGTSFEVTNTAAPYSLTFSEMVVFTNFEIDRCTEVRNTNNSGDYSLRDAISCAQDGETVTVEYPVFGETILLATPILIDKNITLQGFQSGNITISAAAHTGGVFSILQNKSVNINGMKIVCSSGNADGRCVINDGILKLNNLEMVDSGNSGGSAVFNTGNGVFTIENNVKLK